MQEDKYFVCLGLFLTAALRGGVKSPLLIEATLHNLSVLHLYVYQKPHTVE